MAYKSHFQPKISKKICILFVVLGILSSLSMTISAQDTLSFSVNRNVGMAFANYISGSFTLQGSGPDTIQNLTVYFNGEEVHFVTGNSISWLFNTGNYAGGSTNITLVGIGNAGEVYSATQQVVIIGESVSTMITIGIVALVVVIVLAKYGPKLIRLRNK